MVDDPNPIPPQAPRADPPLQETPMGENSQTFTLDDIPPSKWRDCLMAMASWLTADMQYHIINVVVRRFISRLEGRLKEWYLSLGEYCQLQIPFYHNRSLVAVLYAEFVGRPDHYQKTAREEFLSMKCCYFLKNDL